MGFKKSFFLTFLFFAFFYPFTLIAQNAQESQVVNYYGIITSDLDSNMSKMTSELYLTQLNEIQNLTINDFREKNTFSDVDKFQQSDVFSKENLNMYFKVNKIEDSSKWLLSIFLYDNKNLKSYSETKEYDSFYKILMESKNSVQETLKKLIFHKREDSGQNESNEMDYETSSAASVQKKNSEFPAQTAKSNLSTENFSGTWTGENYIDKIVILRGGRGFVIFNNGAAMNISVKLSEENSENSLIITQTSRRNASFFPNIDRTLALTSANTAPLIEWSFQIVDSNTLSGTKKTLVQTSDGLSVEEGEEKVIWNRKS